jgi:hypothetical protein
MNEMLKDTSHSQRSLTARTFSLTRKRESGASLIEIMVVLLVLLIGISLAIRIFPLGFATINATGNRSIAQRLSEGFMEQIRTDAVNLPEAVEMVYDTDGNGTLDTINNVDPDNMDPIDGSNNNPYFSDVNKFRYIEREAVRIPLASVGEAGAAYTLKFGPLYMDPTVGNKESVPNPSDPTQLQFYNNYLQVVGAPLIGINRESGGAGATNGAGFLRNTQNYLVDYGDDSDPAMIMFYPRAPRLPARPPRIFTISYSYDAGNAVQVVKNLTISVPDSTQAIWQPIPGGQDIVPGSETVSRQFERLPATAGVFDADDPYQYKLVTSNIAGGVTPTVANLGVLSFNPAGATYTERTPYGQRPFIAYANYAVLDWHIIRENREVPYALPNNIGGASLVPIRVTLNNIKRLGDSEINNGIYNGIFRDAATPRDIVIFNLSTVVDPATGLPLQGGEIDNGTLLPDGNQAYYVDRDRKNGSYRTGTIFINTNLVGRGSQLRILYKAAGDWAVSLQKARSSYEVVTDGTTVQNWPHSQKADGFGLVGAGLGMQMRFPLADLNKSFVVTLQYQDSTGAWKRLQPLQMTARISGQDLGAPADYDQRFAVVNVADYLPAQAKTDLGAGGSNLQVVGTVQGVSVKTRVIWRDNETVRERWRIMDMDSIVPPVAQ